MTLNSNTKIYGLKEGNVFLVIEASPPFAVDVPWSSKDTLRLSAMHWELRIAGSLLLGNPVTGLLGSRLDMHAQEGHVVILYTTLCTSEGTAVKRTSDP